MKNTADEIVAHLRANDGIDDDAASAVHAALRLAEEGIPEPVDPLDELTRLIVKGTFGGQSDTVAECKTNWETTFAAIRAILAEHEAKLLAGALVPDVEGWVGAPNSAALLWKDGTRATYDNVRAVKVLP